MNYSDAKRLARQLRASSTPAEQFFWSQVRNRGFFGLKFVRQYPLEFKLYNHKSNFFIADFYCHAQGLIVELDCEYYIKPEVKLYDEEREQILRAMGKRVFRCANQELLHNWDKVSQALYEMIM